MKIVDPLTQHKWSSKVSQSIAFNILVFYEVMLCVLIETGGRLFLKRWTKLEALAVLI